MGIEIGQNGYPVLREDRLDLGAVIKDPDTKSGNPFHDPGTGQFTFTPAGMQILGGRDLLKGLSTPTRKMFFQRASITKANQVSARVIDGDLHVVLLRDGRRLDHFAVPPKEVQTGSQAPSQDAQGVSGAPIKETPQLRDAAIDAAREGLSGDALASFLKERGLPTDGAAFQMIQDMVNQKKLDDLIDYLHQFMRKKVHKTDQIDRIRISVGRGYLKRTFAALDEAQTRIVFQRLQGRGWSTELLQGALAPQLPARLKTVFENPQKVASGKEEIANIRKERPAP